MSANVMLFHAMQCNVMYVVCVCIYVCMYVWIYVFMYVCLYVGG